MAAVIQRYYILYNKKAINKNAPHKAKLERHKGTHYSAQPPHKAKDG